MISVVGTAVSSNFGGSTIPLPSGAVAGDLLIATGYLGNIAIYDRWNLELLSGSPAMAWLFYDPDLDGTSGWYIAYSGPFSAGQGVIAIRGVDLTAPFADSTRTSGDPDSELSPTTATFPSVTAAKDGSLLIGILGDLASSHTPPAGCTAAFDLHPYTSSDSMWTAPVDAGATSARTEAGEGPWRTLTLIVTPATGVAAFTPEIAVTASTATAPPFPVTYYDTVVLADNPIAYWPLNEGAGSIAYDLSGHAKHGAYSAALSPVSDGPDGRPAQVMTSQDMTLSSATGVDAPLTVEIWGRWTSTTQAAALAWREDTIELCVNFHGPGTIDTYRGRFGPYTSSGYNDGQWHQLVAVVETDYHLKLYVDGVLVDTQGTDPHGSDHVQIGRNTTIQQWIGDLGRASIYSTPLTATRVHAHYAAMHRLTVLSAELSVQAGTASVPSTAVDVAGIAVTAGTVTATGGPRTPTLAVTHAQGTLIAPIVSPAGFTRFAVYGPLSPGDEPVEVQATDHVAWAATHDTAAAALSPQNFTASEADAATGAGLATVTAISSSPALHVVDGTTVAVVYRGLDPNPTTLHLDSTDTPLPVPSLDYVSRDGSALAVYSVYFETSAEVVLFEDLAPTDGDVVVAGSFHDLDAGVYRNVMVIEIPLASPPTPEFELAVDGASRLEIAVLTSPTQTTVDVASVPGGTTAGEGLQPVGDRPAEPDTFLTDEADDDLTTEDGDDLIL